jgi:hypothetical protein
VAPVTRDHLSMMAARASDRSSGRRRPPFPWFGPTQLWVTLGLLMVVIGSFLPWWQTFLGTRWGLDTYGIWTVWAASVGLVGAMSTRRALFELLPALAAVIAMGVVVWVGLDGVSACRPASDGSTPCQPGMGLVLTGAGALNVVFVMLRYQLRGKVSPGGAPVGAGARPGPG